MSDTGDARARRIVLALCAAQILNMAGTMTFPALIPTFIATWGISNSDAGWIAGIAFAGYVAVVPFVVGATDRVDARAVVIAGTLAAGIAALGFALLATGFWSAMLFRLLGGIAHAATYMPGLKALSDRTHGPRRGRYQSFYTASYSLGSSLSLFLAGLVAQPFGWPAAFAVAALVTFAALPLLLWVPAQAPAPPQGGRQGLLDFRPVLAERRVMAFILAYAAHCFELFGFRTWLVAFLAFAAALQGVGIAEAGVATIATVIITLGLPASILGNEVATRFGRRRVLVAMMAASAACAVVVGLGARLPFAPLVALVALYGVLVMADSASLTVGAIEAARPERRGATIAVHTFMGSLAALASPLAIGLALDLAGGGTAPAAWAVAFLVLAAGVALGPVALLTLGRRARPQNASRLPGGDGGMTSEP